MAQHHPVNKDQAVSKIPETHGAGNGDIEGWTKGESQRVSSRKSRRIDQTANLKKGETGGGGIER
jgi:hypothetical protein